MQQNRGLAKILVIVSSVLVLTAIISLIFLFSSEEKPKDISLDEAKRVIEIDERADGVVAENIIITEASGNFARGRLVDSEDGLDKDFYLIKIGDIWRVVDITDEPVSCERFSRMGFPSVFIQDCKLTFSDAVTLSEIDATLDDFFKSSENTNLRVIATVESVEYVDGVQIVTIDSGGEIIQIQLSDNDPAVQEGDLIVTTITPPNNRTESSTGSTTYTATNPVIVNEDDRDLYEENSNTEVPNNSNIPDDGSRINKITAPKTYAPPSYFKNVYDTDNSFIEVELDGSF